MVFGNAEFVIPFYDTDPHLLRSVSVPSSACTSDVSIASGGYSYPRQCPCRPRTSCKAESKPLFGLLGRSLLLYRWPFRRPWLQAARRSSLPTLCFLTGSLCYSRGPSGSSQLRESTTPSTNVNYTLELRPMARASPPPTTHACLSSVFVSLALHLAGYVRRDRITPHWVS